LGNGPPCVVHFLQRSLVVDCEVDPIGWTGIGVT
jgi:hypothetical protein